MGLCIISYPTALKTYMRRLHRDRPDRFRSTKSNGQWIWEIEAPEGGKQ